MLKQIFKTGAIFSSFLVITGVMAYLTLTYTIKNEDSVVVPELVGKHVVSVLEKLTDLGLNTKVSGSEYTFETPKNHIISQDPEAGTIIKKGRDVRIIFSKGSRSITMPSLIRIPIQQAGILLSDNGMNQGVISYTYSNEIEKNKIITHVPEAGTTTNRGNTVNILVSKGKRPGEYFMPDLKGMTIDEAILLIEKKHLKLGEVKSVSSKKAPQNVVTFHEPHTGSKIMEGGIVSLVINRTSESNRTRVFQADSGPRLFRHIVDNGFLKKHTRIQMSSYGSVNEVFNNYVKPGEEVWVMVPVNTEATVFLYEDDTLIKTQFFN